MRRLTLVCLLTFSAAAARADDFYHDFRKPLPPNLIPYPDKEGLIKEEPQGLRITIPKDWQHPFGGVGVKGRFELRGDFEMTASFEILKAEEPETGYGVGIMMHLEKADSSPGQANLCRLLKAKNRDVLYWEHAIGAATDPDRKVPAGNKACLDKSGRLRMKRTGTKLAFLFAPPAADDFQLLHTVEFGSADVKKIALAGVTGRQLCALDVRLLDLRITGAGAKEAVAVAAAPAADKVAATGPRDDSSLLWIAGGAVAVAVLASAVWLVARRRRSDAAPREESEVADKSAIEKRCPHCDRKLKLSPKVAGKKIKCPGCASVFVG